MDFGDVGYDDLDWINLAYDIESSGGLFWNQWWTFEFHKRRVNFWLAERLWASQERLTSTALSHNFYTSMSRKMPRRCLRGCIQKFQDWVDNEIQAYNNKHSLRSNTKGYGGKTHYTDSQNSDTTAPSGRELYHMQFSLQAASLEAFGYSLVDIEKVAINGQYQAYRGVSLSVRLTL
jgi:hypothetical protein